MPYARHEFTVVDSKGNIVTDAQVEVRREIAGALLAVLYEDRDGTTPLANPFNVDPTTAVAAFHVAGGAYRIRAFKAGFERIERYVGIGTASETDAGLIPTSISTAWAFDDATTDADPGSGLFRLNNATPASATQVFIDNENAGGNSVTDWLDTLDDSGESAARGQLIICDPDQPTEVFRIYTVTGTVTDGTGYRKVSVTHITGAGSFTADTLYSLEFRSKGVTGEVPNSRTLTAGAGLTGGGDLSANRTFDVGAGTGIVANTNDVAIDKASDANVRAAASDKVLTSDHLETSSALVALTESGGSVAVDWDAFINGSVPIDENTTIANPTNGQPGTWRTIYVIGNNTTDRTISFGNQFDGELPTITDCDSTRAYLLMIYCITSTHFCVSAKQALSP
jgi:hypothetical protein